MDNLPSSGGSRVMEVAAAVVELLADTEVKRAAEFRERWAMCKAEAETREADAKAEARQRTAKRARVTAHWLQIAYPYVQGGPPEWQGGDGADPVQ
jgi:hypothetical protein